MDTSDPRGARQQQREPAKPDTRSDRTGSRGAGRGRQRQLAQNFQGRPSTSNDGHYRGYHEPHTTQPDLRMQSTNQENLHQFNSNISRPQDTNPSFSAEGGPNNRTRSRGRFRNHRRDRGPRIRPVRDVGNNESQIQPQLQLGAENNAIDRDQVHPRRGMGRGRGRGGASRNFTLNQHLQQQSTDNNTSDINEEVGSSDLNENIDKLRINGDTNSRVAGKSFVQSRELITDQSQISENQLRSNKFECMICCDNIGRYHPIWYCGSCYNIFHLKCAIEWCNKSIRSRNEAIANSQYPSLSQPVARALQDADLTEGNRIQIGFGQMQQSRDTLGQYQQDRMNSVEWPCPTCREVLHSRPGKYKCFCGKVLKPDINKLLTPHSCGQMCGRKRPNAHCPHSCNAICHPGRCAPCQLTSRKSCYCGKVISEIKCSIAASSCGQLCGKPLSCKQHTCPKICHSGPCGSCQETLELICYCGDKIVEKSCDELQKTNSPMKFSCDKICGKLLDCGKHRCAEKCHPNPECRSCKLLSENIKTCPCGMTQIKKTLLSQRTSCTDPVPTCENKCNKTLICGPEKNRHKCQKKCHVGPCPPCKLKTTAHCECKLSTRTIECLQMYEKVEDGGQVYFRQAKYMFTCETRCNKPKNCGRHRCNNKCCQFNKTHDPNLHKCDQICNKKLPCGVHNCPEQCHLGQCGDCTNIGWTELTCHCGGSVLYPPIPCGAQPPACHRPCRRTHNCGHPVKHECHDDTEKCAPCTVFVNKTCFCGADSKGSVYCYLPGYSCGRTCKKPLKCGQHSCKRVCHDGDCEVPNQRGVIVCNQPCPVPRFLCKHPCDIACHGKTPCRPSLCKRQIEITCACGNKSERIECYKLTKDVDNKNKVAMMSSSRNNQDSIMIDLSKKVTSTSSGVGGANNETNKKTLECDETCSTLKRNKALAEALDIAQPDLKPTGIFGEDPLRLLKEATAQDYKFVSATYNSLVRLIKSARESDKRFIFLQFPPAEKLRREVVHELAHHFNCTSESQDDEPFRHVVVRAYKNKSSVPEFAIEQLLPMTDD